MKNYVKLSLTESIQYLIRQYTKAVGKITDADHNRVKVSITIPTHYSSPEYKEDSLLLKNQIQEAEKKLSAALHKKEVAQVMKNIKEAEATIDYSRSMHGLALYADNNFSTVLTLPVSLRAETLLDARFDIRPLYRSIQQVENYYVLTISKNKIRLLQAVNRIPIREVKNEDFPFENTEYYTDEPKELAQDTFTENLIKEFFNVADKRMQKYIMENPLPLILAGDTKTVMHYQKMMDYDYFIIGHLGGNYDDAPFHEIIKRAYPLILSYKEQKNKEHIANIENAKSTHLAESNLKTIYAKASLGNVKTLYIGENFSVKGVIENDMLNDRVSENDPNLCELSIEIINKVAGNNGKIIFLEDELLEKYAGILLVTEY